VTSPLYNRAAHGYDHPIARSKVRRAGLTGVGMAALLLAAACPGELPQRLDSRQISVDSAVDRGPAIGPEAGKEQGVTPGKEQGIPPGKEQGIPPGKELGIPPAGLGGRCSSTKPCVDPLGCLMTKAGASEGFCTKECPVADFGGKPCAGGPVGTGFFCIYGDAPTKPTKAFCGFICQAKDPSTGKIVTFACPPELKCGPPDDGMAVCE
jgi:hypothetical protein